VNAIAESIENIGIVHYGTFDSSKHTTNMKTIFKSLKELYFSYLYFKKGRSRKRKSLFKFIG